MRWRAEQSSSSAVCVQRLAGKREMGFAKCLALCRVRMDQAGDVFGKCLPVRDQLRFAGKLTHPGTDHVNPDDPTLRTAYQLDEPAGLQNLRLAIAGKVIGQRFHIAKVRLGLIFGKPYRRNFGVAVGDAWNLCIGNRHRHLLKRATAMGNLFGDEDAMRETPMRELQSTYHVSKRVHPGNRCLKSFGDGYETILKINTCLLVAKISGLRSAADSNQHDLCLQQLPVRELHAYAGVSWLAR